MKCKIAFCFLIPITGLFAQKPDFRNAIYLELGGNAGYYSVNYERTFPTAILGKIGISGYSNVIIIPALVGKYFDKSAHHIELMAGVTYAYSRIKDLEDRLKPYNELYLTAFAGYRYQKPGNKFLFRLGYTPFYAHHFSSWFGLSFGRRF